MAWRAPTAALRSGRSRAQRNTVYLAGSVHALPKDHAQLSPQLELAYGAADAIVMEVDLDDLNPLEAVQFLTSNGTLPTSQTLADVIGKDKYATVARLANSLDLPEMAISRLEPWAAAMVLTQFALMKTGFDPQLGIDMQLTERARGDGKPIEGLETIGDQLGIFDSRSQQEQIQVPARRRRRRAGDAAGSRSPHRRVAHRRPARAGAANSRRSAPRRPRCTTNC